MGKLEVFEISFANPDGVFNAGTLMQGQVTIELPVTLQIRGIKIRLEGRAEVCWREKEHRNRRHDDDDHSPSTEYYRDTEIYFNHNIVLYGNSQGSNITELPSGRHVFPFEFQLPEGLPSSFEGGDGHVRYLAKCNIDICWKCDHTTKRCFTVISILDLNQQPHCSEELEAYKKKNICCWCCSAGSVHALFHIERQGFVPGEGIKLYAEIVNRSNKRLTPYVTLKMVTTFHAKRKSRTVTKEVARITRPSISSHRDDVWSGEHLVVPPLPPSFLIGCRFIDIHYILQLTVALTKPCCSLNIPFEIIIGTVPLTSVLERQPLFPSTDFKNWTSEVVYTPLSQNDKQELPPTTVGYSYSESVTGRVNIRDKEDNEFTRGNLEYAPVYTYYDWGNTPSTLPR